MTIDDITKAYAWQEALELSRQLAQICEEFSDADTNVLVWHLRQAVVDIPAGIAVDLQADRPATMEAVVKLVATLELVAKIYPAIETSGAEGPLQQLLERMQSDRFKEREPDQEAEQPEDAPTPAAAGTSALAAGQDNDDEEELDDLSDDDDDELPSPDQGSPVAPPKVDGVGRQRH